MNGDMAKELKAYKKWWTFLKIFSSFHLVHLFTEFVCIYSIMLCRRKYHFSGWTKMNEKGNFTFPLNSHRKSNRKINFPFFARTRKQTNLSFLPAARKPMFLIKHRHKAKCNHNFFFLYFENISEKSFFDFYIERWKQKPKDIIQVRKLHKNTYIETILCFSGQPF